MANHVLSATEGALKSYFEAAGISGLDANNIVRTKESFGKTLPVLICSCENATRQRAKNWLVKGTLLLKSDPTTDTNYDNLDASTTMEANLVEAMETNIPIADQPQPLANAITAAGIAAGSVIVDQFLMTAFTINSLTTGFDDDSIWTFAVDFTATVIA